MHERLLRAFEIQFLRLLEELTKTYPDERQLSMWNTGLQMKLKFAGDTTRKEMFDSFVRFVYEPFGALILAGEENELIKQTESSSTLKGIDDEEEAQWFTHFRNLYLTEADAAIKQTMWQYMKSLTELAEMIHEP